MPRVDDERSPLGRLVGRPLGQVEVPANRAVAALLGCVVLGLVPWTVWLGTSLPLRFEARQWNVVWTGFDVALMAALAGCAWAAYRRRPVLIPALFVAGTLLACDARFDVLTSFGWRREVVTLATAFAAELPLAGALLVGGTVLLRRTLNGTLWQGRSAAWPRRQG